MIKIECYDKKGVEAYDLIVRQTIQDLQLIHAIRNLRIFMDPREPVFIIIVEPEKTPGPVYLDDICSWEYKGPNLYINVENETYLPDLLRKLRELGMDEKVSQPSRFEIIIEDAEIDPKKFIVRDPAEILRMKIYDAIFRIIPEGFRVIENISTDELIGMVCSDTTLKEEWIKKGKAMIEEMRR